MIKKFVSWLYMNVVYLPLLKEKIEADYPGVKVTCTGRVAETEIDDDPELENRIMRQAWFERERIPDDNLH